jgi:hypothetical protein
LEPLQCYIYRQNQLHLLTIRDVERGEKLILPEGVAHWQGNEEGLLIEYVYETEHIKEGDCMSLVGRHKNLRCFKMEMGMESTLIPYQDWTAELLHLHSCTKSLLLPEEIDFDMECLMYFRYGMGLGLNIDSQGVCLLLNKDKLAIAPYGPD